MRDACSVEEYEDRQALEMAPSTWLANGQWPFYVFFKAVEDGINELSGLFFEKAIDSLLKTSPS